MQGGNLTNAERLAGELKSVRRDARITQQELADTSGVSRTTIKAIERGDQVPKAETLRLIADGAATDGAGERDAGRGATFYDRLMRAAGYTRAPAAPAPQPPADPEAIMADLAHDPEIAALIVEAARKYPAMTDDQRRFFVYALRAL